MGYANVQLFILKLPCNHNIYPLKVYRLLKTRVGIDFKNYNIYIMWFVICQQLERQELMWPCHDQKKHFPSSPVKLCSYSLANKGWYNWEKKNLSYFQTSCIIGLCGRTWIFQLDEDNRVCRTPDWFKIFGFSLIFVSPPMWEKAERKSESK